MEELSIQQFIERENELKAALKKAKRDEHRLCAEFCKAIKDKFFKITNEEDLITDYVRVCGAKCTGTDIHLDVEGIELGRDKHNTVSYAQQVFTLYYWGMVGYKRSLIARFKEISEEEYRAVYDKWSNFLNEL